MNIGEPVTYWLTDWLTFTAFDITSISVGFQFVSNTRMKTVNSCVKLKSLHILKYIWMVLLFWT